MKQSFDEDSVKALVIYRLQHAKDTFAEVSSITESGFYNTRYRAILSRGENKNSIMRWVATRKIRAAASVIVKK